MLDLENGKQFIPISAHFPTTSEESTLVIPDQEEMKFISGRVETNNYPLGTIVQLERIGYAILTSKGYLLMHE